MAATARDDFELEKIGFLVSLIFHLGLFLCLLISKAPVRPIIETVEVTFASPPPVPVRMKPLATEQIVRQETPVNNIKDKEAEFLSAHDQKVAKQTQAQNGKFNNERAKGEKKPQVAPKTLPDLTAELAAKDSGDEGKKKNGQEMATDDYLKDVEVGMQTVLSTRQFAYYNYYALIKERIGQYWEPSIREKVQVIGREGRGIATDSEHTTELAIVIDKNGNLVRVDIIRASGNKEIDEMAIKAFHSAAPFPKPPAGLVDSRGEIKIRYDFIIQS